MANRGPTASVELIELEIAAPREIIVRKPGQFYAQRAKELSPQVRSKRFRSLN